MLISPAFAQAAGGAGGMGMQILPFILIFVVFYFLLIRPQQKKAKTHREMLAALRRGDRIVTAGGLVGTITRVVNDAELAVVWEGWRRLRVSARRGLGGHRGTADRSGGIRVPRSGSGGRSEP